MADASRALAVVAAACLILAACDGGRGLCDGLPGSAFRSEEQISAVLGPEGVEPADEFVEFSDTEVVWIYSDVGELGMWTCRSNRVSFLDGRFEADVLEEDGRLVLDRNGTRYLEE